MSEFELSELQWRERLSPEAFRVLRQAGTERPGSGTLLHEHRAGTYSCGGCSNVLFDADTKFDSGCGWPSFYEAKPGSVVYLEDNSLGVTRIEVRCAKCDGHLGHVFPDAPQTPTGHRFCMNSVALSFQPES